MNEVPSRSLPWRTRAALFLGAFLWRLVVVLVYSGSHPQADRPVIDEASYDAWAQRIAAGDWLGSEVFFQEPLYPYALGVVYSLFGVERVVARVVQALLGALTAVLVAELGSRVFGRRAGLVGGIAFALHRPAVAMCALLLKPNLFLPIWAGLLCLLVDSRTAATRARWFAIGLLGGLGALLRGNALLLVPWLVVWPLLRARTRGNALASLLVVLGCAVPLGSVALRNHVVGDAFVLTTSGAGTNVYGGNNVQNPHGLAREFDWVRGIPEHEAGDWRREAERRTGRSMGPEEVSSFWLRETLASLTANPGMHLAIFGRKLLLTLGSYEVPDNHHLGWDAGHVWPLRVPTGDFGWWGWLGLAGLLWTLLGRVPRGVDRAAALELAAIFALYLATIVLTVTSGRVRLALVPLLCPFAGLLLVHARAAWQAGARGRLLAAAVGASLLVFWPIPGERMRSEDLDERDHNLAVQYLEDRRLTEGEALTRELLERHGSSQRVASLLAGFELARALVEPVEPEEAQALLASAWQRVADPRGNARERFRADSLAGSIALEQGRAGVALERLARARLFDPEDPELTLTALRAAARVHAGNGVYPAESYAELRALARDGVGGVRYRAAILLAEVDFALGAHALATRTPEDLGDSAEAARDRVRAALGRLRSVSENLDLAPELRVAARIAAARMQLSPLLDNREAAAGHLRAAQALDPEHPVVQRMLSEL